eukprot:g5899.t1
MVCDFCAVLSKIFLSRSSSQKADSKYDSKHDSFNVRNSSTESGTPQQPITTSSRDKPVGPFEAKAKKSPKYRATSGIREVYRLGPVLGSGGFATVKQITDRRTGQLYACKIMGLPAIGVPVPDSQNSREDIFKEIEILSRLDHENIVGLLEFYYDDRNVYLVSELLKGGELLDAVLDQQEGYSEDIARSCFQQLMLGIHYLHSEGVAHRDLKLENLLLVKRGDISRIKITDFGLAKLTQGGQMSTIVGTPQYVAPEIIRGLPGLTYSVAVDMWSAGVILFILLGGYPPFYSKSDAELFDQIRHGRWNFDDPVWKAVSKSAKDLISKLLVVDPEKRLSAEDTLNHSWMKDKMHAAAPLPMTHENMRNNYDKWKKAVRLVSAVNKFKAAGAKTLDEGASQS